MAKSSQITIRAATREDVPAIIALVNQAFQVEDFLEGTRTDATRMENTLKTGEFLVATDAEEKISGAVYVELHGKRGYFGMLAVDPALQGRGLGRALIEAAENRCRTLGCSYMDIKVLSLRSSLPEYYRRFGYVQTGVEEFRPSRPLKNGVACHCILMSKQLAS